MIRLVLHITSKYDTFVFSQYLGPNMIRLVVHGTLVEVWYFHFFTVPWSKAPRKGNKWVEGMVVLWVPDCDYILHETQWIIYDCLDNNAIDYISMINIIKWIWSSEFLIQRDGRKEAARGTWRELVSEFDILPLLSSSSHNWYCLSLCQGNVKEADTKWFCTISILLRGTRTLYVHQIWKSWVLFEAGSPARHVTVCKNVVCAGVQVKTEQYLCSFGNWQQLWGRCFFLLKC